MGRDQWCPAYRPCRPSTEQPQRSPSPSAETEDSQRGPGTRAEDRSMALSGSAALARTSEFLCVGTGRVITPGHFLHGRAVLLCSRFGSPVLVLAKPQLRGLRWAGLVR